MLFDVIFITAWQQAELIRPKIINLVYIYYTNI